MSEKAKRKSNPRRRLLMRLILGIGILVALTIFVIKQFEPEHLYLVYESNDEDTFIRNLYLYDATTGETIRQITDNNTIEQEIVFTTSSNAPYVIYQYHTSLEGGLGLALVNLKTGQTDTIETQTSGRILDNFSLDADGNYFLFQKDNQQEQLILTHLLDINTGKIEIIHEYDYQEFAIHDGSLIYPPMPQLSWINNALVATFVENINERYVVVEYNLEDKMTTEMVVPFNRQWRFLLVSPDGQYLLNSHFSISSDNEASLTLLNNPDNVELVIPAMSFNESLSELLEVRAVAWYPDSENLILHIRYQSLIQLYGSEEPIMDTYWRFAIFNIHTQDLSYVPDDSRYNQIGFPKWGIESTYLLYIRRDRRCAAECVESIIWNPETNEQIFIPQLGWQQEWVRM